MKTHTIITVALLITVCFSGLLIRLSAQDHEIARQREQIAMMRETAEQARQAFDRMQKRPEPDFNLSIIGDFTPEQVDQFEKEFQEKRVARKQKEVTDKQQATKDLDAEIETLEIVSKER